MRILPLIFAWLWALAAAPGHGIGHPELYLAAVLAANATPGPTSESLPDDDGSRVTILGYHEFSVTKPPTAMRLRTDKFREHMQALKDLKLPVISLEEFKAWKSGKATIPPRAVLITIDDGWKSVYSDAFPILKEFGYPFTLFLYKNYVDGGGRALTTGMIREMQQHGCSIGSHSVSHPFPGTIKSHAKKGAAAYEKFLRREFGDSRSFLEQRFKKPVVTYAYPGGYVTEDMFPIGDEYGYHYFFTVKPGKIRRNSPNHTLARYIILGNYDQIFEMATSFHATGANTPLLGFQSTPHPVHPEAGSMIESRLPTIWADLSGVENLDPASVTLMVAGFGKVPAGFDPATGKISWTVNRRLRQRACEVAVHWRLVDQTKPEPPMRWTFLIDREAAYQAGAE